MKLFSIFLLCLVISVVYSQVPSNTDTGSASGNAPTDTVVIGGANSGCQRPVGQGGAVAGQVGGVSGQAARFSGRGGRGGRGARGGGRRAGSGGRPAGFGLRRGGSGGHTG